MNITGYKLKLVKAREMLKGKEEELREEARKRGRRRDNDLIESLEFQIKSIKEGMNNLRNGIKELREKGKKK